MKHIFYHLPSYADKLRIAAEEIMVDIMDVQVDNWVAVTYENNWLLGIVLEVRFINSSINSSQLPLNYPRYLFNGDRSLSKIILEGENEKLAKALEEGQRRGLNRGYRRTVLHIYQHQLLKPEIFHHLFDYNKKQ